MLPIFDKLYIPTISISKTSNKISLTSYYYKLLFWETYIFLFHKSLIKSGQLNRLELPSSKQEVVGSSLTGTNIFFFIFIFIYQFLYFISFYVMLLPIFDINYIFLQFLFPKHQTILVWLLIITSYYFEILISFYSIDLSQRSGQLSWLRRPSSNPEIVGSKLTRTNRIFCYFSL